MCDTCSHECASVNPLAGNPLAIRRFANYPIDPSAAILAFYSLLMKLAHLLTADQIILDMKAGEHWESIVELVEHLVETGNLPAEHQDEMLEAFRLREESVSTGIGSGVAIPHAFSDDLTQVVAVFGRSWAGIDFQALDDKPVHFIILFIVPRKNYHLHLQTLAAIAKTFTNAEVLRQLGRAQTQDDVLAIFDSRPARAAH
jgi:mannitol/fructose-specific phosphotransferase system IIA component (Ntr-type)